MYMFSWLIQFMQSYSYNICLLLMLFPVVAHVLMSTYQSQCLCLRVKYSLPAILE